MKVLFDGNTSAPFMLIGEAPGKTELITKRPFTGRSGQLLRSFLLNYANLSTDNNLYITNVVKFNPTNNRTPTKLEVQASLPELIEEIKKVNPKLIILCGATAHNSLLNIKFANMTIAEFNGYKTYSIFHPAYILRNYKKRTLYQTTIENIPKN